MNFTILIADDEKNIREGLATALELDGYITLLAENGEIALDLLKKQKVDLVITDLRMPRITGDELLKHIVSAWPTIPVIVLTGHGTIESAVKAMQDGAFDFLTKPVDLNHLAVLIEKAFSNRVLYEKQRELEEEVNRLKGRESSFNMIGKSPQMKRVMDEVERVAKTNASVLITGESGVGKELVANAIRNLSDRRKAPFVKTHCAALAETLLESELFGHVKGAFTNALSDRKGRFEEADGGTLFLDEVGEFNQNIQVKLLRVLQEKTLERVGSSNPIVVNVRLISATNRDLKAEIQKGSFREDLYYRLNVVNIHVPPLRERREDIPLLAASFLRKYADENNKNIQGFENKAMMALYNYDWPGNIRELQNCIENAVVMTDSLLIKVGDLPSYVNPQWAQEEIIFPTGLSLEEVNKKYILSTLDRLKGNKSKAALELGIGRKTLHRKLEEYGIT